MCIFHSYSHLHLYLCPCEFLLSHFYVMSYDVSKQFLWPGCRIRPLFYRPPPLWMRWRHIFIHFTQNATQFRFQGQTTFNMGDHNINCNQDKSLTNMFKCTNAQTMSWKYIDLNELTSNYTLAIYCKNLKIFAVNLCAALCQWFVSTDAFESTCKDWCICG